MPGFRDWFRASRRVGTNLAQEAGAPPALFVHRRRSSESENSEYHAAGT